MNKKLLFLITTFFTINGYSQISFEQGYYIDNNDQKIECLIKNMDWRYNPTSFEYKNAENNDSRTMTLQLVKEFGINNTSKYIRKTVAIDKSSENINLLSYHKNPDFEEEQLFLNVLIEGKASLYLYENGNLKRYFYNINGSKIEQLVFKIYRNSQNTTGENQQYKQQLLNKLKCATIGMKRIENIKYKEKSLVNVFVDYNNCSNLDFVNFKANDKEKDLFNLTIRPRVNNSSFSIRDPDNNADEIDLGSNTSFGLGIETEFILPFNKNKWSVIFEPTFQYYKFETTTTANHLNDGTIITKVNYSSIEIPLGLRHYFFLNKNSKIFINASYVYDIVLNTLIDSKNIYTSKKGDLIIESHNNLALGLGFKWNDKYGLEIRYQTKRDLLKNNPNIDSGYQSISAIVGYSFF